MNLKRTLSISLALIASICLAGTQVRNTGAGYQIGGTTSEKVGFFGATPVVQPTSANQTALTDNTGGSVSDATLADSFTSGAALTDSTTGSAGTTLAAGVGVVHLIHPLTSLATGLSTSAIDIATEIPVGFKFKLISWRFVTTVVGTGTSASQVFNLEIGSPGTNVTGGVLTLNLTATNTIGKVTEATAISAANTGTAADVISIEMAASGTVFTAGAGYFDIIVQNMDTADAFASLSARANTLRTDTSVLTDNAAKTAELVNAIRTALVNLGLITGS